MRRFAVIVMSVLLASMWLGPGADAQSEGTPSFPTLLGYDMVLDRHEETSLFGDIKSEDPACYSEVDVTIRGDESDDFTPIVEQWEIVATDTTTADGNFFETIEVERSMTYVVLIEDPPAGCYAERSDYWGIDVRADITLDAAVRTRPARTLAFITAHVAPVCSSVQAERDPGGYTGQLYLEKLTAHGWKRLTSEFDESDGCNFTFKRPLRRTDTYRIVGEGYFVNMPGFEYEWIGKTTEPVVVRPPG